MDDEHRAGNRTSFTREYLLELFIFVFAFNVFFHLKTFKYVCMCKLFHYIHYGISRMIPCVFSDAHFVHVYGNMYAKNTKRPAS